MSKSMSSSLILSNILILIDGYWHLTGQNRDNPRDGWPDWIIAGTFNKQGMPVWFHRVMGVFLILSSIYLFNAIRLGTDNSDCYAKLFKSAVLPLILTILLAMQVFKKLIVN